MTFFYERRPTRRPLAPLLGLLLSFIPLCPAMAQAPGAGGPGGTTPSGGANGPGATAPAANGPSPGVAGGVPGTTPSGRTLTLADVVALAVGGNSGLVVAHQRLQKAQELINQVNAQGRPQLRADANDTYSSYPAFAPTLPSPAVSNPTLPGGGTIPVVVDQAAGFSTAFIGGGGGGNAPGNGAASPLTGLSGVPASGTGVTPGVGTGAPTAIPGRPTGGTGTAAPGVNTPPAPNLGGAGQPGPGQTTPGTAAPGTTAPGATAPGGPAPAGNGAATGLTFLSVPAIIAAYVADMHTLTEVSSPAISLPKAAITHVEAKPEDVAEADQPRQPGDTSGGNSGGNSSSGGTSGVVSTGGGVRGQRNNSATRVSVSQYIDLFGLLSAARDTQNDVRDFYALDITRLQNETALAAKNLFFDVLLTQAQVATQQEQITYAQENVRITQARLRQGIVSRFDVLTAQTALATAQQQLIAAQDQADLAQSNLSYLLGTDPDQPLTLLSPPLPPLDQHVDLPQSTQIAQRQRPELRQAARNIQEAQRLVKLAGSTLLPTLGVVGSGEYNSAASQTTPRSYATVSAELAVPLDDGGATRSRVRSAQVDVQTQDVTLAQLKQSVALEVRQATVNVRSAQAQVGAAQAGVTQAREAVRLAYVRYQGGIGTFLDVLNALAQLAVTRTNLSNAEFFYQTSLAQLVRALGGR